MAAIDTSRVRAKRRAVFIGLVFDFFALYAKSSKWFRALVHGKPCVVPPRQSEPPVPLLPEEGWPKAGVEGAAGGHQKSEPPA